MKILIATVLATFCLTNKAISQNYIDTVYSIVSESNIVYGSAINFAGQTVSLQMDISRPTNDIPPGCGRPLVLIVHGGAWIEGNKNESYIPALRQDFAKRGYVAVAINYRLGFFQTNVLKNCTIPNWNCMNVADSAEWSRALYRGIQDAHGAIRYMAMNESAYNIDLSNVYVVGESAGAFIAMGLGFMDDDAEKPTDCGAISSVLAPHQSYYTPCVQNSQFDIPIAQMNLTRPDLGPIKGTMNPTNLPYFIRGVGAFYGGMYKDLFTTKNSVYTPVLYMFHQPNDLIVPFGYNKLLNGFNACAVATNCLEILERKTLYGSDGINNLVDTLNIPNSNKPQILFQVTNNTSDCISQVLNPATGGHQLDSYLTRNLALATFFAPNIGVNDCVGLELIEQELRLNITVFPNPSNGSFRVKLSETLVGDPRMEIIDVSGRVHYSSLIQLDGAAYSWHGNLNTGVYFLRLADLSSGRVFIHKLIVN